jgi:hypothetical protein
VSGGRMTDELKRICKETVEVPRSTILVFASRPRKTTRKLFIGLRRVVPEVRTQHLPNASLKRYR